jgi:hypothetical protein
MPTRMTCASFVFALAIGISPNAAQAGSFCNWLFGGKCSQPAYPVGGPVPLGVNPGTVQGFAPGYPVMAPGAAAPQYSAAYGNFGSYFGSGQPVMGPQGAGYPAVPPGGITAATLPAQPMSFVPNFNSSALRAPVTYYRPVMTTDPNTGAQVVAMMPCTSYQYMTQRVPAFGRTSLFGSYQPPAPPSVPTAVPSYTLPSGGIPLAQNGFPTSLPGNSFSSPAIGFGTAPGFGGYSTGVASPSTITVVCSGDFSYSGNGERPRLFGGSADVFKLLWQCWWRFDRDDLLSTSAWTDGPTSAAIVGPYPALADEYCSLSVFVALVTADRVVTDLAIDGLSVDAFEYLQSGFPTFRSC